MYASELIVSPLTITSTRITPSVSQKTVIMSFQAEGVVLNSFFLGDCRRCHPIAFSSPAHNGEPRFRHLWRFGTKRPPPPQHQNATTFQNRWLSFDVCVRLWDFEEPIFAHTVEYPKASIIAIALSITGWKLYGQLPTCDAPMRLNNAIGALQHVWAGGCGRTPRPRSIMQLRSPLPEALTLWIQRPTVLLSTEQLPYTAHNRLWMFPTLYFPATKNSITARCLWRVSETNAIFTDYYSGAICRTTVYLHTCGQ